MPRYYRRRSYTRVVRPKKRWASNIMGVSMTITNTLQSAADVFYPNVLAQNKTESSAPAPVIVKTGNFKLQADISVTGGGSTGVELLDSLYLYIVFVPQGMVPGNATEAGNLINNHPEWVMAWKLVDTGPTINPALNNGLSKVTMSTRLKRNLNSGDAIYAICLARGLKANYTVKVTGLCQYWTCAN